MKLLSITAVSSGLLLAAITLQGAHAQTQPTQPVTRDALRICMNSESGLGARRKTMAPRNDRNREEAAAIRAEAQELADEQKRLEEANRSMDRFNRRVKAHNARVQAARANEESFSADLEALNKALIAHNDQCGGISFKAEDKEAILKERESATK